MSGVLDAFSAGVLTYTGLVEVRGFYCFWFFFVIFSYSFSFLSLFFVVVIVVLHCPRN